MNKRIFKWGLPALLSCAAVPVMAINVLENGDFSSGRVSPWEFGAWEQSVAKIALNNGRACVDVTNPGAESWAIQLRQNNMIYADGHAYSFSADVWATAPITLKVDGSDETGGYTYHFGAEFDVPATPLSGAGKRITTLYANDRDTTTGKLSVLMGKGYVPAGTTVCIDNIVLDDADAVLPDKPAAIPVSAVRVNQHGYLPDVAKKAVYVIGGNDAANPSTPRNWTLIQNPSSSAAQVASGKTTYLGLDPASGDVLHSIDFSDFTGSGADFALQVAAANGASAQKSLPFAIRENIYSKIQYDALAYFYHNRSSTPILASVVGAEYARAAGHPDTAVETYDCIGTSGNPNGCRTADVSGGWYDAGDHGKYVVNGGISVWTMLNQFERSINLGSKASDFADGKMALPAQEKTNGIPDILDEAAWEIEWFMKMQVPAGYPYAGMVHHKVHTKGWTAIPTLPADDKGVRVLQPVSTAATLNAAAVGAQCYRVYKTYNSGLSNRCLAFARKAYTAAKANPAISAPSNEIVGSGLYGDRTVTDEFYWAATELYLATGESSYRNDMLASDYHKAIFLGLVAANYTVPDNSFSWPVTELLGVLSMAVVSGEYVRDAGLKSTARTYLTNRADHYVAEAGKQGYGLPYDGVKAGWGSNSNVVNNMMLIALANDFTCGADPEYLDTLQGGMNYLLGSNPMDQSYVTGYGERSLQEPHHRFWAKAASNLFPAPPPGAMSGGPNQGLEDEIAKVDLVGCKPLKCFLDEIESYSTNEITVNWNAPFAWVSAYMNEQSTAAGRNALCGNGGPVVEPTPTPTPTPTPDPKPKAGAGSLLDVLLIMLVLGGGLVFRRK